MNLLISTDIYSTGECVGVEVGGPTLTDVITL